MKMAIIIDENTRVVVQGITGGQGRFHTRVMKEYGTNVSAGVTPGKGGGDVEAIPVYDSIDEVRELADASIIFVPAPFAKDAALEAISGGMNPVVIITEHIPVHDSITIMKLAADMGTHIIGPNTPGILSADKCKMGVMPSHIFKEGQVGLISRSGTLTYEIVDALKFGKDVQPIADVIYRPALALLYPHLLIRVDGYIDIATAGSYLFRYSGGYLCPLSGDKPGPSR